MHKYDNLRPVSSSTQHTHTQINDILAALYIECSQVAVLSNAVRLGAVPKFCHSSL